MENSSDEEYVDTRDTIQTRSRTSTSQTPVVISDTEEELETRRRVNPPANHNTDTEDLPDFAVTREEQEAEALARGTNARVSLSRLSNARSTAVNLIRSNNSNAASVSLSTLSRANSSIASTSIASTSSSLNTSANFANDEEDDDDVKVIKMKKYEYEVSVIF